MQNYIEKRVLYPPFIKSRTNKNLGIVIVIPAFNEPDLISSLQSLKNCARPNCAVDVIIVINSGENVSEEILVQNKTSYDQCLEWASNNNESAFSFHPVHFTDLPSKHAGVGLARKIGLDEAVRRFKEVENDNGILVCFDADSYCESNYLTEIEQHFHNNPKTNGCSIYFEHPIEGTAFEDEVYNGIIQYEIHLRYFIHMQRKLELPYAYQTIGSSMAVRADAYCALGGMNKRKAGEDFYFLHKFIKQGFFSELKTTRVIPSPRVSDRVPFGTGKAIGDMIHQESSSYFTYHPKSFDDLDVLIQTLKTIYDTDLKSIESRLPESVTSYLSSVNAREKIREIKSNISGFNTFVKRFYHWFDAFRIMKYLHYCRDHFYPDITVSEAMEMTFKHAAKLTDKEKLNLLRKLDKEIHPGA